MDDDIFAQLADLVSDKPSPPPTTSTGFGGTTFTSGDYSSPSSPSTVDSSEGNMSQQDDVITPTFKPTKSKRERKLIITIDDDFSTLDLMKIYLQRDYEYVPFDNPKNAIFYLNGTVPDLIFIDRYLNVMNTKRVIDIIRTYKELSKVPIIYLAEPSEESAIKNKLPEGVLGIISRPIKRADIQQILDTYISNDDDDDDENVPISHDII